MYHIFINTFTNMQEENFRDYPVNELYSLMYWYDPDEWIAWIVCKWEVKYNRVYVYIRRIGSKDWTRFKKKSFIYNIPHIKWMFSTLEVTRVAANIFLMSDIANVPEDKRNIDQLNELIQEYIDWKATFIDITPSK